MATDDKMTINERYQYLRRMQKRYQQADRKTKSQLLDEMETHTGLHRKSLIRLLKGKLARQPRSREREATYGPEVDAVLAVLWEAVDYVCPERLTPNLSATAELLVHHQELALAPRLRNQLETISVATVRRHLPPLPLPHRRRRLTAAPNRHQQQIPAYRIPRDIAQPGYLELDLVHHCGTAAVGEYVYTLQLIDVATGWSARRAILGRSYLVVADALHVILPALPFTVQEIHPDNGSEFLNAHLLTFLTQEYPHVQLSRSRPGHPNDNRLVEQKNSSLVRDYLGDRRFDTIVQTRFLNSLYAKMGDFYNFIQPVMKQIAKEWVSATADRPGYLKRTHDTPRPPALRLCTYFTPPQRQSLLAQRAHINPLQLRREIYRDLDQLFAYPNAAPNAIQDVFQTLANPDAFPEACVALAGVDTVDNSKDELPTVPIPATTTVSISSISKEAPMLR